MEFTTIQDFFKSVHQWKADFDLPSIAGTATTSESCPGEKEKENEPKAIQDLKKDHKSIPYVLIEKPAVSKKQISKKRTHTENAAIKQISASHSDDQSQSSEQSPYHMEADTWDVSPIDHSSDLCPSGIKVCCFI
jgi:hypothetical protein